MSVSLIIYTRILPVLYFFFFFNDTATTEIYTLSLHDALPICPLLGRDESGELAHPEAVLGDRFWVAHSGVPPAGPPQPLEHPHFEREGGQPGRVPVVVLVLDYVATVCHSPDLLTGRRSLSHRRYWIVPAGREPSVPRRRGPHPPSWRPGSSTWDAGRTCWAVPTIAARGCGYTAQT